MRSEIHRSIARWYSGKGGFVDRIVSALIVALGAAFGSQAALAQSFVADGTTVTATGSGIIFLRALNGGVINSFTPLGIDGGDTLPVFATTGGTINIFQGSTIQAAVDALHADDPGSTITVTGTLIMSSAGGAAIDSTGATINILGGSTVIAPLGVAAANGGTLNISGSTISSETAMVGIGPDNTINLTNSTVTATLGTLPDPFAQGAALQVLGGGTTTLNADASQITGTMVTDSASTSTVNLSNGTLWTMTGNSNVTNLTNAASTINFTPPVADPTQLASYKTLTVMNYAGANGTIRLNTFLGADSSPSDRLIINGGTAAGTTFLNIANTVGTGALTTGSGILVVDAINGATTDDAFRLAGPVIAGPFEYMLFKGNGNPEAWYLRSTVPAGPDPCPLPPPVAPVPDQPGPPAEPVLPPGEAPNYRQEVSLYATIPNLGLLYGRKLLDTLHQRVGEETGADRDPAMGPHGAWGRVIGQRGDRDGGCPVLVGPSFDYGFAAVQAGFDALRAEHRDGSRDRAGVYAAMGDAHADVTHSGAISNVFAGRDSFAAYSVGAYWTHYGAWGWYLDGVLQGTWYDVDAQSTRLPVVETNGWGLAASLEAGVPYRGLFSGLGLLSGLTVEPQTQLVYQSIDLADSRYVAAQLRFENVDSLAGRLGVRFAANWAMPGILGLSPAPATVWFRPSYWHEFSDDARVLISSEFGFLPFPSNIADDWVELNVGLTVQVGRTTALFASGSYDTATDGNGDAWDGRIGLKVTW